MGGAKSLCTQIMKPGGCFLNSSLAARDYRYFDFFVFLIERVTLLYQPTVANSSQCKASGQQQFLTMKLTCLESVMPAAWSVSVRPADEQEFRTQLGHNSHVVLALILKKRMQ